MDRDPRGNSFAFGYTRDIIMHSPVSRRTNALRAHNVMRYAASIRIYTHRIVYFVYIPYIRAIVLRSSSDELTTDEKVMSQLNLNT